MVRAITIRCVAILFLLSIVLRLPALSADEPPAGQPPATFNATAATPDEDAMVEQLLDQTVSVEFREKLLAELISYLANYKIDAYLDEKAIEEAGLGSDTPMQPLRVANISVRSLLNLVLRPFDLTYVVRDGKLQITTTDVAYQTMVLKIYQVDDLVRVTDESGQQQDDFYSVIDLLTTTVDPDTWDEVGGPGSISEFQGTLAISATGATHATIARLLAALRESRAKQLAGAAPTPIWAESAANLAAMDRFSEKSIMPADFEFAGALLSDAVDAVAKHFNLQAVLDDKALEEAGLAADTPVTANLRHVTLPTALSLLLEPLDLTHLIANEVVLVTTTDVAEQEMSTVVYPVADLVQFGPQRVGGGGQDFDTLIELITTAVVPDTWDEVGGPGTITEFYNTSSLVASQTQEVHGKIDRLLVGLRKLRVPQARQGTAAVDPVRGGINVGPEGKFATRMYILTPQSDPAELVKVIRIFNPKSWGQSGAHITITGSGLVVRNTRAVLRDVTRYLDSKKALVQGGGMRGMSGGIGGGGGGMF